MRGMFRSAIVLLALFALFMRAQCVVACSMAPCGATSHSDLPPCHRHHSPANQVPSSCTSLVAVVVHETDLRYTASAPHVLPGALALQMELLLPSRTDARAPLQTISPPGVSVISTVILRI